MRPAERLYSNITRHCHSSYGMAGTVALLTALLFRTVGTAQPSFSWEFASGVFVNAIERLANNDLLLSSGGNGYSTQNAPLIRMAPDGTVVWARWMPARSQGKVRELPNGDLLARPDARELMEGAAREAAAAGRAQGFSLTFDNPVLAAEEVARRTAANHSSMFQDIQRGAPTEIDAICGAVVEAGEQTGVLTPVNRTLWRLVRATVNSDQSSVISNRTKPTLITDL